MRMLIRETLGNLATFSDEGRAIDRLPLEWFETNRHSLQKRTGSGREVVLQFLAGSPGLRQDDVLYADERCLIVVEVLACEAIVLKPASLYHATMAGYQVGSRQLPLFVEAETLLVPYDAGVYRLLQAAGFEPQLQKRKLLHQLHHAFSPSAPAAVRKQSFFSRLLSFTATPAGD